MTVVKLGALALMFHLLGRFELWALFLLLSWHSLKAIAIGPAFTVAYLNQGHLRQAMGDHVSALSDYDRGIAVATDHAPYDRSQHRRGSPRHTAMISG